MADPSARRPGVSVRFKLTLSYAAIVMVTGSVLLALVWFLILRNLPSVTDVPGGLLYRRQLGEDFARASGTALIILLFVGLAGGWALAGRMLAPLNRINEATAKARAGSLSHRINLPGARDELRDVADGFDAMLTRIEADVASQQRFAANASHELRTPLAITQTLLEVARDDPSQDRDALIENLHGVNRRAIDLTEALLLLSRAEQRSFSREAVDLSLLAEDSVESLLPLAEKQSVSIEVSGGYAPTQGSTSLLSQLVTNLVQNAIVHNRPSDGTVLVSTETRAGSALLVVENTGERISPVTISRLTEPFQRGTERIHHDQAGVGLGLAIVKSIVEAHSGTLTLEARPGGGMRVVVELPA